MLDHPTVANGVSNQTANTDHPPTPGLTITEAARRCGVTREAIRLRIRRGKLRAEKIDGQWLVFLGTPTTSTANTVGEPDHQVLPNMPAHNDENMVPYPVLVNQMEGEIAFLREQLTSQQRQLEDAARERSELRQLLALQVTHALPESRRTEAPVTAPVTESHQPQERRRRWWWPFTSTL